MDKINITLQPEVDLHAVDHVRNTISRLSQGDEITITVESTDAHQADPILHLLDKHGFDYQSKGSHDGKAYHINAKKMSH